jgi:NAD(P)-dependent dehydrogenase (short-subunit alcohol dehydrogenase family)
MTRTYVVTGAASGIGLATVTELRRIGRRVVTVDRHTADVTVDLASDRGCADLVVAVSEATGGVVDAVVACAGTVGQGASDVQVNYFGAVATLDGLRPLLARGTNPRAVAVASYAVLEEVDAEMVTACLAGNEPAAVQRVEAVDDPMLTYASAKRALSRWVRRSAPLPEWAGTGIAINSIGPGVVRTPMTAPMLDHPDLAELLLATVPMPLGGVLDPDDVAHLIVTLTDPGLSGVTGQTIFIDGGSDCVRRGDDIWS